MFLSRLMNGWILVNKPCGMSSNDVVQKVKRYLKDVIRQYANDYMSGSLSNSLSNFLPFSSSGSLSSSESSKLQSILSEKSTEKISQKRLNEKDLERFDEYFKKAIKSLKVGHCGTLDVEASGLLVIAVGEATKLVNTVHSFDKDYEFSLAWGVQTTTDDAAGEILYANQQVPSIEELQSALNEFRGDISQVPPKFSAVSVNGKRCYDVMRNGGEVSIEARNVIIHDLKFIARRDFNDSSECSHFNKIGVQNFDDQSEDSRGCVRNEVSEDSRGCVRNEVSEDSIGCVRNEVSMDYVYSEVFMDYGQNAVSECCARNKISGDSTKNIVTKSEYKSRIIQLDDFFVTCSTGTYVRSLCRDIAVACGGYGHAFRIFRTRIGPFSIENAVDVNEFVRFK